MKRLIFYYLLLMSVLQGFATEFGNDTISHIYRTIREEVALPKNASVIHQWLQQHQCKIIFEADNDIIGFEYQDELYLVGIDDANEVLLLNKIFYLENEVYSFLSQKGYLQDYLASVNSSVGIKADASEVKGSNQCQIVLRCEMFTCGHAIDPYMERAIRLLNRWRKKFYPYYNIYLEAKNSEAKTKQ